MSFFMNPSEHTGRRCGSPRDLAYDGTLSPGWFVATSDSSGIARMGWLDRQHKRR
jgi:hypothetical protein